MHTQPQNLYTQLYLLTPIPHIDMYEIKMLFLELYSTNRLAIYEKVCYSYTVVSSHTLTIE